MGDISVDLFLETLKQLLTTSNLDFTIEEQSQLEALEEEIKYLRRFLKIVETRRNTHSKVMNLVVQIRDMVSKAENAIELFIVLVSKEDHASNSLREHKDHLFVDLERVEKDIKNLEAEVKQNFDMMGNISLQFFLEITLKQFLMDFDDYFSYEEIKQLRSFEKEIIDLRGLLNIVEKKHSKHSEVINLGMQIKDVISIAEKAVKLFKVDVSRGDYAFNPTYQSREIKDRLFPDLERVNKEIKNLTFEVTQICNEISLIPISGAAVRSLEHSSTGSRETVKQFLATANLDFTLEEQYQLQSLDEEVKYLWGFLKVAEKIRNMDSKVMNLVVRIRDVISEAENAVELFIVVVSKRDRASNSLREHKDQLFLDLERVEKDIKNLEAEVKRNHDKMGNIYLHLFLEYLKQLLTSSGLDFTRGEKDQLQSLEMAIKDLMWLLNIVEKKGNKHSKVMNLERQFKDVVYDAVNAVKLFIVDVSKDASDSFHNSSLKHVFFFYLQRVIEADINNLRFELRPICREILYSISGAAVRSLEHSSTGSRGGSGSLCGSNPSKMVEEEVVVGFEEEVAKLLEHLVMKCGTDKLRIISIIGPGGCGKTTLARKAYDHPRVSMYFKICAWIVVSQDYHQKRDLLIDIFKSVFPENHRDYEKSSEDDLKEMLYKHLHDKRYLIVMDNVWGIEVWNDIKGSFPDEYNGSCVVVTSRLRVMVTVNFRHAFPIFVKPLSESCSWELLEVKVFGKKSCPPELVEIGKQIAEKCEGLPLAIVTIAGILATEQKILNVWQQIAKDVSSVIAKKHEGCMELLELSYNHLPLHLKVCFLYIGAHPKGHEISVRELTWLWIAEGFIQQGKEGKSLEDVAKDYLDNLIDRNLVMTGRRSFTRNIKTCRILDLLRELCLKKATEDNFFEQINGDDSIVSSAINKHRRLFISRQFFDKFFFSRPYPQNLRSFLCLGSQHSRIELYMSFFVETFKLLRVFSFVAEECRGEVLGGELVHLRYLAIQLSQNMEFPLPFLLFNLETLIVQTSCLKDIKLSSHIFKMVRLRHLYTKQGIFTYHVYDDEDKGNMLDNLHTLHRMCICEHCLRFLERTPNLMKLGLIGDSDRKGNDALVLPDLEFLKCLEKLHAESVLMSSIGLRLPPTLTRLSLKETNLKWEQLSILLQALPSLKVLKLLTGACSGPVWDTTELENGFSQLNYLKLDGLDIEEWKISLDVEQGPFFEHPYGQFLSLMVLVIRHCKELKGIPIEFAYLENLQKINVEYSNQSVEESAKAIQEQHCDPWGDDDVDLILRFNAL